MGTKWTCWITCQHSDYPPTHPPDQGKKFMQISLQQKHSLKTKPNQKITDHRFCALCRLNGQSPAGVYVVRPQQWSDRHCILITGGRTGGGGCTLGTLFLGAGVAAAAAVAAGGRGTLAPTLGHPFLWLLPSTSETGQAKPQEINLCSQKSSGALDDMTTGLSA